MQTSQAFTALKNMSAYGIPAQVKQDIKTTDDLDSFVSPYLKDSFPRLMESSSFKYVRHLVEERYPAVLLNKNTSLEYKMEEGMPELFKEIVSLV